MDDYIKFVKAYRVFMQNKNGMPDPVREVEQQKLVDLATPILLEWANDLAMNKIEASRLPQMRQLRPMRSIWEQEGWGHFRDDEEV